jgi:hypothetical protein
MSSPTFGMLASRTANAAAAGRTNFLGFFFIHFPRSLRDARSTSATGVL